MDIFAAIDLETSGLDVSRCEILDMAIVPLEMDFTISKTIPEFTARIRAEHPETAEPQALQINRMNPADGKSRAGVRDDLVEWMRENGIGQIVPVAHNLEFDLRFLNKTFPELRKAFSHHGRDSMRLALTVNDIFYRETREVKFPSASLRAVKEVLGFDGDIQHNALEDAKDAALVYRRLTELLTKA